MAALFVIVRLVPRSDSVDKELA